MPTIKQNKERVSRDIAIRREMLNKKPKTKIGTVPKWQYPHSSELLYKKQLLDIVALINNAMLNILIPQLPRLQNEAAANKPILKSDSVINDNYLDDINALISQMKISVNTKQNDPKIIATTVGTDTSQFNRLQLTKIMKSAFGVDIFTNEPWLSDQLNLFTEQNLDLIKNVTDKSLGDMKGVITRGFAAGTNLSDITKQLQARIPITENRAKLIARDQVSKLNGQLTQLRQTQNGITHYQWATAGDERVRPTHAAHEGNIYSWDNPPADTGNPGDDINCLIGETKICSPIYAKKFFRRFYRGKTTKFITSSGETIIGTPNHPIFTSRGWLPLEKINIGDDLVCLAQNRINITKGNDQNIKATFEEIFDFLSVLFKINSSNGSINQFHGDGIINENVDIIDINRCLLNNIEIMPDENICQTIFTKANVALDFLPCDSSIKSCLYALGFTSNAAISFFSKLFTLVFGKVAHSNDICLRTISKLNIIFSQSGNDDISRDIIFFGQTQNAITREVLFNKLFFIKLFTIMRLSFPLNNPMSPYSQSSRKIIGITSQEFGNFIKTQPVLHKTISVIDKSIGEFSGHVYNLENYYGAYIIPGNIIVGNCRCTAIPILDDLL